MNREEEVCPTCNSACRLAVCVCTVVYVGGCDSSVKLTREGKTTRTPVKAILVRDFVAEPGVEVSENVVRGLTSSCVQSLGNDDSIKPVPVTREPSERLPEGTIEIRGRFRGYNVRTARIQSIGFPGADAQAADIADLQVEVLVHDFTSGKLLASKAAETDCFGAIPTAVGGRLVMIPLDENEMGAKLCNNMASKVKETVLAYLARAGRK